MRIVIANGNHEADYIIKMFKDKSNEIIVINSDPHVCDYLSSENQIQVYHGDPSKDFILADANVDDADVFLALSTNDIDNYIACLIAKKQFNVKKCICTVINPKNVNIFKKLGVEIVISSTHLLAQSIKNESVLQNMVKTLSLEDEKIVLTEIEVQPDFYIVDKTLTEIKMPAGGTISCIYRDPHIIIPKGSTKVEAYDKLMIISTPEAQPKILEFIQRKEY